MTVCLLSTPQAQGPFVCLQCPPGSGSSQLGPPPPYGQGLGSRPHLASPRVAPFSPNSSHAGDCNYEEKTVDTSGGRHLEPKWRQPNRSGGRHQTTKQNERDKGQSNIQENFPSYALTYSPPKLLSPSTTPRGLCKERIMTSTILVPSKIK